MGLDARLGKAKIKPIPDRLKRFSSFLHSLVSGFTACTQTPAVSILQKMA